MSLDAGCWASLNSFKLHLHIGLSDTTKDNFLEQILNSAYKLLEDHIGYSLLQETITEYQNGNGTNKLVLEKWPVASITSIHVDSLRVFGSDTLIDSGDYYFDPDSGIVDCFKSDGTTPGWFPCGIKNVKVIYLAGYSSIPAQFAEICREYAAIIFTRSGTEGYTSQSMGSKSETYSEVAIPDYIKWKLEKYRNKAV